MKIISIIFNISYVYPIPTSATKISMDFLNSLNLIINIILVISKLKV